jgi:hypothetical protein
VRFSVLAWPAKVPEENPFVPLKISPKMSDLKLYLVFTPFAVSLPVPFSEMQAAL